ncbi:hypothetical protein [Brevibacterium sp. CS2]|uniref:hypothetical protein n=1 Tax=Brevibacterium sp. CS2 TaxID=2575923 RepID=UPI0010C78327|nr:hypothetical protein [Brevibacterium sp. CS2]QCP05004.1 hypothetical protein FDF13_06600 [Brevibacterium sp. CS2]
MKTEGTSPSSSAASPQSSTAAAPASPTSPVIDRTFVETYAPRYEVTDLEKRVLTKDGPKARKKGKMKRKSFLRVGEWKGLAVLNRLELHPKDEVAFITEIAIDSDTPDRFRVDILRTLDGVGVPLASSLLSAVYPDRFAILDARAVSALHATGHLSSENPARIEYRDYLAVITELADSTGCSPQEIYRALYAWSDAK